MSLPGRSYAFWAEIMAWRNSGRVYLLMVFLPPQMVYSHLGASARLFVGLWFLVFIATERKRPIDFGDPKNFPKAKLFSSPGPPPHTATFAMHLWALRERTVDFGDPVTSAVAPPLGLNFQIFKAHLICSAGSQIYYIYNQARNYSYPWPILT